MAETESLRDLVVSLSLDSSQFEKNVRLIRNELKKTESEFRQAAAGAENFEKSLKGMRAKAETLKKQLEGQNAIVSQYEGKLAKTNEELANTRFQHERLIKKLEEATRARDENNRKLTQAETALRTLSKAYGANSDEAKRAAEALVEQEQAFEASEDTVRKLSGQIASVEKNVRKAQTAVTSTETALNNANAEIKEMEAELARLESRWYKGGIAMQGFADSMLGASRSIERVGDGLTRRVTTPLAGLGIAAGKAAIDFESAFAGVRKTVDATGEDAMAFFEGLSDGVIDMSKRLATGADDISEVMAIAGQLGIANAELQDFTETIVRLGMSTDMAGEDAASSMARFANVTGMAQGQFGKMGATLVYLGNRFATTESEIMNMATRIAAAGKQVGLSEPQILGFAAALSSLGLEAEAGGSAFSTALKKMEMAVATNSKALNDFAKVSGLTREQFKALWNENPAEAFQAFVVGLSKLDEEGIGAIATLKEIGISELRLSDTLLRTANATELLSNAQTAANQAWIDGTALIDESNTRLQTTASRMENVKNKLIAAGISFGQTMTPEIERIVDGLDGAVEWLNELDEGTRRNIVNFGLWAAAAGPVIKAFGKVGTAVGSTVSAVGRLAEGVGKANAAFKLTGSAATWLSTLLGPGGKLMLGIGGAAATLYAWFRKIEAEKPDFSIDTSEIENLKIRPEDIDTKVTVNTGVEVKGDILNLREEFIEILNDGVPETKEIKDQMTGKVDAAVKEVYRLLEESYNNEKAKLNALFDAGIIDQATYNAEISYLDEQTDALKGNVTAKGEAVTEYVETLCAANRKMTDNEIETLNGMITTLGETAEAAVKATDAQRQIYELAKTKTKLGLADQEEQLLAAESIELEAYERLQEIEKQRAALDELYAGKIEGKSDKQVQEELEKMREEEALLDRREELIEKQKIQQYREYIPGILEGAGMSIEELREYKELLDWYEQNVGQRTGSETIDRTGAALKDPLGIKGYLEQLNKLIAFEDKMEESGLLGEGGILARILATQADEGLLNPDALTTWEGALRSLAMLAGEAEPAMEGLLQKLPEQAANLAPGMGQAVTDSKNSFIGPLQEMADEGAKVLPDTFDMHSPSRVMYQQGMNIMAGLKNGILAGQSGVIAAMKTAARAAVQAAKTELDINSPSRVFRDEVGAMAVKGLGEGFTEEAKKQAKIMRNAIRYLTGEARDGATGGTADNRRTYNSETSVNLTVEQLVIRDQQDIQTLATEIAGLTRTEQRGKGVRYA